MAMVMAEQVLALQNSSSFKIHIRPYMAHPAGVEPATSAFGEGLASPYNIDFIIFLLFLAYVPRLEPLGIT